MMETGYSREQWISAKDFFGGGRGRPEQSEPVHSKSTGQNQSGPIPPSSAAPGIKDIIVDARHALGIPVWANPNHNPNVLYPYIVSLNLAVRKPLLTGQVTVMTYEITSPAPSSTNQTPGGLQKPFPLTSRNIEGLIWYMGNRAWNIADVKIVRGIGYTGVKPEKTFSANPASIRSLLNAIRNDPQNGPICAP